MSDAAPNPTRPIAIGFYLIALPLFVALWIDDDPGGRAANLAAGLVLTVIGALIHWRSR
jgi:hypothetical protein